MYNHIWGNIYLYCWEHNLDYREIFNKIRKSELEAYKWACKEFMIPFEYTNKNFHNKRKIVGSTLELDMNVLTTYFHIPVKEIIDPPKQLERLLNLMQFVVDSSVYDTEYEFSRCDDGIDFQIKYSTVYKKDHEVFENIQMEYTFTKYFDKETLSFNYCIIVLPSFIGWPESYYSDINMSFYSLHQPAYFRSICLYDGNSKIIADFFEKITKHEIFIEYKYDIQTTSDITWRKRTNDIFSEVSSNDYQIIDFKSIIVKSAVRKCNNDEHHTKIVNGIFFIMSCKTGDIKVKIVPLVYCQECNTFFMYDYEYDSLRMEGKPLCRIYDHLHQNGSGDIFSQLSTESIFKACGYTVDANEDLSDSARHNLLDFLINRKIVTILQTLNFLQWLINSRKNNQNMYRAVYKWESDFSYISEKYNSFQNIIFGIDKN